MEHGGWRHESLAEMSFLLDVRQTRRDGALPAMAESQDEAVWAGWVRA